MKCDRLAPDLARRRFQAVVVVRRHHDLARGVSDPCQQRRRPDGDDADDLRDDLLELVVAELVADLGADAVEVLTRDEVGAALLGALRNHYREALRTRKAGRGRHPGASERDDTAPVRAQQLRELRVEKRFARHRLGTLPGASLPETAPRAAPGVDGARLPPRSRVSNVSIR